MYATNANIQLSYRQLSELFAILDSFCILQYHNHSYLGRGGECQTEFNVELSPTYHNINVTTSIVNNTTQLCSDFQ